MYFGDYELIKIRMIQYKLYLLLFLFFISLIDLSYKKVSLAYFLKNEPNACS